MNLEKELIKKGATLTFANAVVKGLESNDKFGIRDILIKAEMVFERTYPAWNVGLISADPKVNLDNQHAVIVLLKKFK